MNFITDYRLSNSTHGETRFSFYAGLVDWHCTKIHQNLISHFLKCWSLLFPSLHVRPSLCFCGGFIHSDHFYSASSSQVLLRSVPDTARILCRSFTPKRHRQL